MQYDYKYSMNEWQQVITGVEFNCKAAASRYTSDLANAAA